MRIRIHSFTFLHPHGFDCLSFVLLPLAQALRGFGQGDPSKTRSMLSTHCSRFLSPYVSTNCFLLLILALIMKRKVHEGGTEDAMEQDLVESEACVRQHPPKRTSCQKYNAEGTNSRKQRTKEETKLHTYWNWSYRQGSLKQKLQNTGEERAELTLHQRTTSQKKPLLDYFQKAAHQRGKTKLHTYWNQHWGTRLR